jgi:hypothetical protein
MYIVENLWIYRVFQLLFFAAGNYFITNFLQLSQLFLKFNVFDTQIDFTMTNLPFFVNLCIFFCLKKSFSSTLYKVRQYCRFCSVICHACHSLMRDQHATFIHAAFSVSLSLRSCAYLKGQFHETGVGFGLGYVISA